MENSEIGYIVISARGALGAVPLEDVEVIFYKDGKEISRAVTDERGLTERVSVNTPPRSNSLLPGLPLPYSLIDIRTQKEGFYNMTFNSVPVYSGVTSIQPVDMIPLPLGVSQGEEIDYNESEVPDL